MLRDWFLGGDTRAALADQLLFSFLSFAVTVVAANAASVTEFARLTILLLIIGVVLLLHNSYFGQFFLRFGKELDIRNVLRAGCISAFVIVLTALVLQALFLSAQANHMLAAQLLLSTNLVPLSILLCLLVLYESYRKWLYAQGQYHLALKATLIAAALVSFGVIILLRSQFTAVRYLWIASAAYSVSCSYLAYTTSRSACTSGFVRRRPWSFSKWLLLGAVLYSIAQRLIVFGLDALADDFHVAQYRAIETLFAPFVVFIGAIENFALSKLSSKRNLFLPVGRLSARILGLAAVAVLFQGGLAYCGLWLLMPKYSSSEGMVALLLMSLSTFLFTASRVPAVILRLRQTNRPFLYAHAIEAAIVLALWKPTLSHLGILGAFGLSSTVHLILCLTLFWAMRRGHARYAKRLQ